MNSKALDRFWASVNMTRKCWEWSGNIDAYGYGRFWSDGKNYRAHRVSLMLDGLDPSGMIVDHICRNRKCVNPQHLRLVDARTNTIENSDSIPARRAAQTHCKLGHPLIPENLTSRKSFRECRTC